jgi:hypothetical protein
MTEAILIQILTVLRSIDSKLAVAPGRPVATPATPPAPVAPPGPLVAPDADLDSEWGNPEIRKDPPRWHGQSYAGRRYSQTEPAYLDCLAGFLRWKAGKDDEMATSAAAPEERTKCAKYAGYARKDAARAQGWAERLRRNLRTGAAPEGDAADPLGPDDEGTF